MDKIKVFTRQDCYGCDFLYHDSFCCKIPRLSGFESDYPDDERFSVKNIRYKPCTWRLTNDDVIDIVKWFFETQKDKIEYVED